MKYSLSQYLHDDMRINLIETELEVLKHEIGNYQWVGERIRELNQELLDILGRRAKFEKHPHNRG